jgi:hypothetical protein
MADSGGSHYAVLFVEVNRNALDVQRTVVKLDRAEVELTKIASMQIRTDDHIRALEMQNRALANECHASAKSIHQLEIGVQELTRARSGPIEILKLFGIVFSIVVSSISFLKVFGLVKLPWTS